MAQLIAIEDRSHLKGAGGCGCQALGNVAPRKSNVWLWTAVLVGTGVTIAVVAQNKAKTRR